MDLEKQFKEVFEDFNKNYDKEDKLFYFKEPIDDVQIVSIVELLNNKS
jgi:hypothetical protein